MPDTTVNVTPPPVAGADPITALMLSVERMRGDTTAQLARIEGRQEALVKADEAAQKAADHRHNNVMQAIATFVPRPEIELKEKAVLDRVANVERALGERIGGAEKRVGTIETRAWGLIVFVLSAVGMSAFGLFKLGIAG